jgi:hypothetical protein
MKTAPRMNSGQDSAAVKSEPVDDDHQRSGIRHIMPMD